MSPPFVFGALLLAAAARESAETEAPPPRANARCGQPRTNVRAPAVEFPSPWAAGVDLRPRAR
jgi:hypothetical protein